MPIQEKELKGILKSLKQINAALGTVATNDLLEDAQAVITSELATNVILDAAVAEQVVNDGIVDTVATLVGTGSAGLSFTDQTQLLQNVIP